MRGWQSHSTGRACFRWGPLRCCQGITFTVCGATWSRCSSRWACGSSAGRAEISREITVGRTDFCRSSSAQPIKINCAETQPFSDNWDFHEIGIDEFLALCRELDAEPALTLNIDPKICTPEAAAAWVEYCNGSRRTTWGEVRANRGHPRPYHVKYWFVGNEIWGDWMGAAHSDAATYARRLPQYASAIRKVDPSVLLIASGLSPEWDRTLIAQAGSSFDLLSEHNYAPEGNAHAPHPASADFAGLPHFPKGDLLSMLQTAHAPSERPPRADAR